MARLLGHALLALAAAACGGPRFHPVGPPPSPIAVERVTLQWSNVYLLRREGAAMLVDSGSPGDRDALAAALAARGVPPSSVRAVVITHAHADHAGCARWLQSQGAKVFLGAGDAATAGRGRNEPLRPTGLLGALLASVFMFPFEPFTPDAAVDRELDLAEHGFPEVRVVPVSGHTPGSIAVLFGDVAFVGDMIKGGELLARSPTEHLYQTEPAANYRELDGLLARGVSRLYLGHSGPLDGADVKSWLRGAGGPGRRTAIWMQLDARGERREDGDLGGSGGLRARYAIGRAGPVGLGYLFGVDVRGGYLGSAYSELNLFPLGLSARSVGGASLTLAAGLGLDGPPGSSTTNARGELAAELPAGPLRVVARGVAGWVLGGMDSGDLNDLTVSAGVRIGRDRQWGDYVAGKGPFLALSYRRLDGEALLGISLGVDLFAGKR